MNSRRWIGLAETTDEEATWLDLAPETSQVEQDEPAALDAPLFVDNTPAEDEAALVEQAQHDPLAFGVLYERYVERIYAYIYHRVGNVQDTEDLTARIFYRALDKPNMDRLGVRSQRLRAELRGRLEVA